MPKIVDITHIGLVYELGPARAYGMSRGLTPVRNAGLIQLETDSGVIGFGEAWGPAAMVDAALDVIKPYLVGREIYDREQFAPYILAQRYHMGIQNTVVSCLSGINIALYDAIGKLLSLPLYQLLGGRTDDRVPAYASDGYFSADPESGLDDQLAGFADQGFPAVKIKIGHGPAADEARVARARDRLGPETLLMVDANGNYTVDLALESMRRIRDYGIHFYEEPLAPTDVDGYRRLAARAPMPIATGEALYTGHDFKRLLDADGADILQPDLTLCGGIDSAREIAAMARLYHRRLSPHVWGGAVGLAASVHFVAALPPWPHTDMVPDPVMVEYDQGENPLRDALLTEPIACVDGHLIVPDAPGLGVQVDWDVVERYRVA